MTADTVAITKPLAEPNNNTKVGKDEPDALDNRVQYLRKKNAWLRSNINSLQAQVEYWKERASTDGVITPTSEDTAKSAVPDVDEKAELEQMAACLHENNDALRKAKHAIVEEIVALEMQYKESRTAGNASASEAQPGPTAQDDNKKWEETVAAAVVQEQEKSIELASEAVSEEDQVVKVIEEETDVEKNDEETKATKADKQSSRTCSFM